MKFHWKRLALTMAFVSAGFLIPETNAYSRSKNKISEHQKKSYKAGKKYRKKNQYRKAKRSKNFAAKLLKIGQKERMGTAFGR